VSRFFSGEHGVTLNEYAAGGDVVWEDAEFLAHVEAPEDVTIGGQDFGGGRGRLPRSGGRSEILGFVLKVAVVAVRLTVHVKSDDFASVRDGVGDARFNEWRGTLTKILPV
jgi:hypothetical protein